VFQCFGSSVFRFELLIGQRHFATQDVVITSFPATCQLVWQEPMFEGLRRGSSPKLPPFPCTRPPKAAECRERRGKSVAPMFSMSNVGSCQTSWQGTDCTTGLHDRCRKPWLCNYLREALLKKWRCPTKFRPQCHRLRSRRVTHNSSVFRCFGSSVFRFELLSFDPDATVSGVAESRTTDNWNPAPPKHWNTETPKHLPLGLKVL